MTPPVPEQPERKPPAEGAALPASTFLSQLKRVLTGLLLTMTCVLLLLAGGIYTETGSRLVIKLATSTIPVELGEIRGNLLTGLDISHVNLIQQNNQIRIDKMSFRWRPFALFYSTLAIDSLSMDKVNLRLADTNRENQPFEWPDLTPPFRVQLNHLAINQLHIQQGATQVSLQQIASGFNTQKKQLRIQGFSAEKLQMHPNEKNQQNLLSKIKLNATVNLTFPYALNANSEWTMASSPTDSASPAGQLSLTGDITQLQLTNQLRQPFALKMLATISPALKDAHNKPHLHFSTEWPAQALPTGLQAYFANTQTANVLSAVTSAGGKVDIEGWWDELHISPKIQLKTTKALVDLTGDLKATGVTSANKIDLWVEQLVATANPLDAPANPQTDARLRVTGHLELPAQGNNLTWNLQLTGNNINTAHFVDDWPSNLQLQLASQGQYRLVPTDSEPRVQLSIGNIDLHGELRNLATTASGNIDFDGEHWSSSNARLTIGANQLLLKGTAGNRLAMEWKINAPLLNQIDPSLGGSVVSTGKLLGSMEKPLVEIHTEIRQLRWQDVAIEQLDMNLIPRQPLSDNSEYELTVEGRHLQAQAQRITQLTLKGKGTLAQHLINAHLETADYGTLSASLDSSWANQTWQGKWKNILVDLKKVPRWYLSSSSPMQANASQADGGRVCLTTATALAVEKNSLLSPNSLPHTVAAHNQTLLGEKPLAQSNLSTQEMPILCVEGGWNKKAGARLSARMTAAPVELFRAWFKPDVTLQGVLDGQLDLQAAAEKPLNLNAHLQTRDVQLTYQFQGDLTEVYPLQKGSADVSLSNKVVSSSIRLDLGKYGTLNGDGKYSLGSQKIQATVSGALNDLAPLETLLPFLNDVKGAAQANFSLEGTLEKPELQGQFLLNNASANMPKLGLELRDISIQMAAQNARLLHVDGQVTSGDGTLMLKGDLSNVGSDNWFWQSNIYGANIRVIQQPQLIANLSPNLTLTASSAAINLTGSTEIPWARALLKTLPASATRVSNDVTIIENESAFQTLHSNKKPIPINTNVILYFGDDARFKGFGLDTQLIGKINVLKEEKRQTLTTGFVAVGKGNYKAYGQDLSIERGRLIFQGPYDNPGLDIRAQRVIDPGTATEITAGLEIGGTLQQPKSKVFSIPARADSEAMAILLTGKPLAQSSTSDAYSLLGAISSLGMDEGQSMTKDIAHLFRMDEVTIKADKGLQQSELWAGKYVTPKLFIRYMVGLFDQAFTLGMRYQLNDKLRLEAESGKTQSVDIIYKIER